MEDNGMAVQNKKFTWFTGYQKALLDHVTTNHPNHVSNINTEYMGKSDHLMVSFDLKTKENTENSKYHDSQIWKKVNMPNIELAINFNPDLQEMWMEKDKYGRN